MKKFYEWMYCTRLKCERRKDIQRSLLITKEVDEGGGGEKICYKRREREGKA